MNWEAIGAVGEVLGAIAVLATLVYLARQIQLSNKIAIASSETELRSILGALNFALMDNADMAEILASAQTDSAELSSAEEIRLAAFLRALLNSWISIETAYSHEMAPEETYNVMFDNAKEVIEVFPGCRLTLRQLVNTYPAVSRTKLMSFLDELLKEQGM